MTVYVPVGDTDEQLSRLVAAALRGEEVLIGRNGEPQVRLTPNPKRTAETVERIAAKRKAAFGMFKHPVGDREIDVPPSMTEEEVEERWQRKFGPAA